MKEPDGVKKILLIDHIEGQCRAIVGFKDGDPRSAYMCGEPVCQKTSMTTIKNRFVPQKPRDHSLYKGYPKHSIEARRSHSELRLNYIGTNVSCEAQSHGD
ncbi:hypothetical protein H8B02_14795 [Bradyrhizobium sp. Pear77]|uniref:hypothetical protein n=1 Tax=Bradyrhizobium TaxID=374 RepID=UPI001E47A459|nr:MULTISPECIES: hypothetical protein [Bradyrhizobium]MCC8954656.1 hypothetical protein [Bradyrhizobium altum]MCC8963707.1 hypothetical protein [Bradyrhizobium oropedii]